MVSFFFGEAQMKEIRFKLLVLEDLILQRQFWAK